MPFETVTIGPCTLIRGDCLEVLPTLRGVDAVVTDPPYGTSNNCDYTRFSGGQRKNATVRHGRIHKEIAGDSQPFDPSPWLQFDDVILWGANNYSDRLPPGGWLVWDKKQDGLEGQFMSDCEVAWRNSGCGVFLFRHRWDGFNRQTERGEFHHPSQKPVALMRWCVERTEGLVLDPYMGSGSTGIGCVELEREFIGIESDPEHFAKACSRIRKAWKLERSKLPLEPVTRMKQMELITV